MIKLSIPIFMRLLCACSGAADVQDNPARVKEAESEPPAPATLPVERAAIIYRKDLRNSDISGRWVARHTTAELVFLPNGHTFSTMVSSHLQVGQSCDLMESRAAGAWGLKNGELWVTWMVSDILRPEDGGRLKITSKGMMACDSSTWDRGAVLMDGPFAAMGPFSVWDCRESSLHMCMWYGNQTYIKILEESELPPSWLAAVDSLAKDFPKDLLPSAAFAQPSDPPATPESPQSSGR